MRHIDIQSPKSSQTESIPQLGSLWVAGYGNIEVFSGFGAYQPEWDDMRGESIEVEEQVYDEGPIDPEITITDDEHESNQPYDSVASSEDDVMHRPPYFRSDGSRDAQYRHRPSMDDSDEDQPRREKGQCSGARSSRQSSSVPRDAIISIFQQLRKFRRTMSFHWLRYRERFNYVRYGRNDLADLFAQLQQELGYHRQGDKQSGLLKVFKLVDSMNVLNQSIAAEEGQLEDIQADIQREEDQLRETESRLTGLLGLNVSSIDDDDDVFDDFLKAALSLPDTPVSKPVLDTRELPEVSPIADNDIYAHPDMRAMSPRLRDAWNAQEDNTFSVGLQFWREAELGTSVREAMLNEDVLLTPGQIPSRSDIWEMIKKPFEMEGAIKETSDNVHSDPASISEPNMMVRMFQGIWGSWLGKLRLSSLLIDDPGWSRVAFQRRSEVVHPPSPRSISVQSSSNAASTVLIDWRNQIPTASLTEHSTQDAPSHAPEETTATLVPSATALHDTPRDDTVAAYPDLDTNPGNSEVSRDTARPIHQDTHIDNLTTLSHKAGTWSPWEVPEKAYAGVEITISNPWTTQPRRPRCLSV